MSVRIATAFAIAIMAAMAGTPADAACPLRSPYRCGDLGSAVNLNLAPDVTNKIVDQERASKGSAKPSPEDIASKPYTGPILKVPSGTRAPTIGYSWSIE